MSDHISSLVNPGLESVSVFQLWKTDNNNTEEEIVSTHATSTSHETDLAVLSRYKAKNDELARAKVTKGREVTRTFIVELQLWVGRHHFSVYRWEKEYIAVQGGTHIIYVDVELVEQLRCNDLIGAGREPQSVLFPFLIG